MLVLVLGGARSGKSELAVSLASAKGAPVTLVATAEALDVEMRERIDAHRAARPAVWETIEEPHELERALESVEPVRTLVVDCLTLWLSNLVAMGADDATIVARSETAARIAAPRPGLTVVVTNEVGLGIVPATPLGRAYRDLLGTVNRDWASVASETVFMAAGRALRLEPVQALVDRIGVSGLAR